MSIRLERITEEIKKELSSVILELKDPRLSKMVSIVGLKVTNDLRFAKVYVSVLGSAKQLEDTVAALKSAAGFIRREIGHRINLRYTPEFSFVADNSIENGIYISKLIQENVKHEDESNG